jgi:Tfp pilus assembly protein PilO
MPEAIAIIAVTVFVAVVLVIMGLRSAGRSPQEKMDQLQQRLAWLQEHEKQADANGWDAQMRQNLADQLEETRRAITALKVSLPVGSGKEADKSG